ncbi:amino acid ABC transporter ATP-binding/permease protein, partial [Lactobacillus nasalidis]
SFVTISAVQAAGKIFSGQSAGSLTALLLACAFSRGLLHYGEHYCNHLIAFKMLALIRVKVFHKLRQLSPAKLESKDKGSLLSLITSDIELLEVFYAHTISPIAIASLFTICMLSFFSRYSVFLALLALLAYAAVGIAIPLVFSRRASQPGQEIRQKLGQISSFMLDSIMGLAESLQFGQGPKRQSELAAIDQGLTKSRSRLAALTSLQQLLTNLTILLSAAGMLALAKSLQLPFAQSLTVTSAMLASFGPVSALSALSTGLTETVASGRRVLGLLDEAPLLNENAAGDQPAFAGAALKQVSFSYPGSNKPVLKDYSLTIPKGKIIGIHAPSGSGKSTILKLLARFYDVQKGQVTISESDVRQIKTAALRQLESYMPQETWLATDTVANNISLGRSASREEIIACAKKANIHDFIMTLPDGYDSIVGQQGSMSAGQKQRVGIARAFLHGGDLLLLDEITANLDALNEGIVLKSIKEAGRGKTVVLVSHRTSTLAIADEIVEL